MVPNSYDALMTVFMTVSEAFDAVFIKKLNKTLLSQNLNLKHVIDFYLQKKFFLLSMDHSWNPVEEVDH